MNKSKYRYPAERLLAEFADLSAAQVAGRFGVHRSVINRWRQPGAMMNQWDADRYAVMLGKHPGEVWPEWFDIELRNSVGV
jgi:hypothetical protein